MRKLITTVIVVFIMLLVVKRPSIAQSILHGEVRWTGNLRRLPEIARVEHRPPCPDGAYRLIERKGRHLVDVAVWLTPIAPTGAVAFPTEPASEIILNADACAFHPRLSLVGPGTSILVTNRDPQPHWLVAEGSHMKRRQWRQRSGDAPVRLSVGTMDRLRIWSGWHRWMEAWVVAVATPWRTVTDADGAFAFADVPPGEYVLHAWHPWLGEETQVVQIPAKHAVTVQYRTVMAAPEAELSLAIPILRDEWRRPRGDTHYQ